MPVKLRISYAQIHVQVNVLDTENTVKNKTISPACTPKCFWTNQNVKKNSLNFTTPKIIINRYLLIQFFEKKYQIVIKLINLLIKQTAAKWKQMINLHLSEKCLCMFGDVKETAHRWQCCLLISYTVFYTYHHNKNGLIKRLGRQPTT